MVFAGPRTFSRRRQISLSAVPADQRWAQLKRQFDTIDSDGDGFITHAEFTEHFPHLPAEAIGALDGNADGRR
ncbi:hypothetical protein GCM10022226_09280 [Sphaerisporangium flaviroseum]|uniref:EF-hand domain-containing protein n=1 Tax=Sphaerisporangium flaviroseum TaxID=509199 RepID=A0ABP7HE99_9ACTN